MPQATGLTLLEQDFESALAAIPSGYGEGVYEGLRYGVVRTVAALFPAAMETIRTCHWKISSRAAITNVNERYRFTNTGNSVMRIVGVLGVALAGLFVIGAVTAYGQINTRSQYGGTTAAVVDDKGNLRVPSDYRTAYQMLGSWAVAKDDGPGSKEMHMVYASPGTIVAYRKDGHFPDGTVLVKEVFKTTTKDMTTGTVSSAGTLAGWFVMVKDSVGRFPGNKLWGDGWGWSWFDATNPRKTTSTDYTTDCQSCHEPARQSDWIYTHGYPVLSR